MISRRFGPKQRTRPVGWWEPRWSFVPRTLRETRSAFPLAACIRILFASAVAALVLFAAVEIFVLPGLPALKFNWLGGFAQAMGRFALFLAFWACLSIAVPPRITVSAKGVMRQVGQAVRFIKRDEIRFVHVVLRRPGRHFIRVETAKGALRIGLSRNTSLLALDEHFGDRIVVHDRRRDGADQPAECGLVRMIRPVLSNGNRLRSCVVVPADVLFPPGNRYHGRPERFDEMSRRHPARFLSPQSAQGRLGAGAVAG